MLGPKRSFTPALSESLFNQLASYAGISIFTDSHARLPTANGAKGLITVPFMQKPPAKSQPSFRTHPISFALSEIEQFRLMLMCSSVECSE
ncbi:MAG: hypothetical protein HC800_22965 [Phormidesmis sp. RL_2_1]|nr:hypothetical protein [Phormidesmis sp. RL_2_1]